MPSPKLASIMILLTLHFAASFAMPLSVSMECPVP